MDSFVAFLDILGTTEKVRRGEFSDLELLDFANPVGSVAHCNPAFRFAVFSDSVILSCETDHARDFVSVLSFLYSQWFSDHILVRGGVSVGEVRWVDDSNTDDLFRRLKNFMYARVYGKALVAAIQLEERSGPGAICYVDERASRLLSKEDENFILQGQTDALIWADDKGIEYWLDVTSLYLSYTEERTELRRHLRATVEYYKRVKESGKALQDEFALS